MHNKHPHFISPQTTLPQEEQEVLLSKEPYLYEAGFIFTGRVFRRHVFETGEEIPMERIIGWAPAYLTGPLVFLDIDGVLTRKPDYGRIDPGLLTEFLRWADATGAVLILISSWREERFEQTLRRLPRELAGRLADQVPPQLGPLPLAILRWKDLNAVTHDSMVILDDEADKYAGTALAALTVSPKTECGMSATDYAKANDILNNR